MLAVEGEKFEKSTDFASRGFQRLFIHLPIVFKSIETACLSVISVIFQIFQGKVQNLQNLAHSQVLRKH